MTTQNFKFSITDDLRKISQVDRTPDESNNWLNELPVLVEKFTKAWDIKLVGLADAGAMSCCLFGESAGAPIVLKIPKDKQTGVDEIRALRLWNDSNATPKILRFDLNTGVLMMERIFPDKTIRSLGPRDVVKLLQRLHIPIKEDPNWRSIKSVVKMRLDWAEARFRKSKNYEMLDQVDRARRKLSSMKNDNNYYLHGDFQLKNILSCGLFGFRAIDPLPCCGPREADAALWAVCQRDTDQAMLDLLKVGNFDSTTLKLWVEILKVAEYRS